MAGVASTIDEFPDEILELVLETLYDCFEQRGVALIPLLLVSSRWHRIATPWVYRHITITPRQCVGALIRTLISQPDLAGYVDHLGASWTAGGCRRSDPKDEQAVPRTALEGISTAALERLPAVKATAATAWTSVEELVRGLQGDDHDIQMILLLHLLPNLRRLKTFPRDPGSLFYALAFRGIFSAESHAHLPAGLQSACDVEWSYSTSYRTWDVTELLPALTLPRLSILRVGPLNSDYSLEVKNKLISMHGTSSVRRLCLRRSHVGSVVLGDLLLVPSCLQELLYEFPPLAEGERLLAGDWLGRMLQHVRHSLVRLQLHIPQVVLRLLGALGSLAGFSQLQSLSIDAWLLLGLLQRSAPGIRLVDLLPPSIQRLNLEFGDAGYPLRDALGDLLELLASAEARFPGLRHVTVGITKVDPDVARKLEDAAQRTDVRFEIVNLDSDENLPVRRLSFD